MKRVILSIIIGMVFTTCSPDQGNDIEQKAEYFYQTYSRRQNFEKFMDFYDDSIVLEDIINGDRVEGKEALRNFFDWGNPNFKSLEANSLVVSEKVIQQQKALIKGYFTKFQWGQVEFEAMHFTTFLTFNESGKIIKQVDWINYPASLVDYNKRKNSNKWIH